MGFVAGLLMAGVLALGCAAVRHLNRDWCLVAQVAIWQAGWDLLFSPLAQIDRLIAGLAVAVAALSMTQRSSKRLDDALPALS